GWQPRWFVLDNGILSYYKSQEDVNNGCKGSIKMSACDISGLLDFILEYLGDRLKPRICHI
ncbi:hypothetical protein LOTGIDRAFT_147378, partial [Lottia gigantea]